MTFRTHRFGELSWAEAAELVPLNPVILLPIGVMEQHGPHLPLDEDNIVAEFVADAVARRTGALVLPTLNYGHSPIFRNYCGTISLSSETLRRCIVEIVTDLHRSGFRRFVLVNNNGGNLGASGEASFILHEQLGITIAELYPWGLGYGLVRDLYDDPDREYGHGGEPEMSAMMAMFPDRIIESRIEDGGLQTSPGGFEAANYTAFKVPGHANGATIFWQWDEVCPSGASGNTRSGDSARGEKWIERVVSFCSAAVEEFDRSTSDSSWAQVGKTQ